MSIDEIISILCEVPEYKEDHHLRRPYLTAYQLAIRFAQRFPNHPMVMTLPLGGEGTGQYQSLAQAIARFLSQEIAAQRGQGIEGGFLSHQDIQSLAFTTGTATITPSTLRTKDGQSIFRYNPIIPSI